MISPPSSISNGPEPQLPPLPPPLRSTQVLQPLSVYPVSALSQEATYDYVFGGPLDSQALSSTLKLTSPPIRLRSDVYRSQSLDSQRSSGVDDGRSSSAAQQHSQHHHHSLQHSQHSHSQQHSQSHSQSQSRASSLKRSSSRYINCNDGTASIGSRKSNRSDGEDEDSLRQLLIDFEIAVIVQRGGKLIF